MMDITILYNMCVFVDPSTVMEDLEDESLPLVNAEGPYKIDQCTFANRLKALYSHWLKHENGLWRSADFLAIYSPPDEISNFKSTSSILWLLGYKFPETTMIFGREHIYILCDQKNASSLESVKDAAKDAVDVDVVIHSKLEGEDKSFEMDAVLRSMLVSKSKVHHAPIVVGYTVDETLEGSILKKLSKYGFQLSDVTAGLSDLFCSSNVSNVQGSDTVLFVKKVAYLTVSAMKYFFIPKIRRSFDMRKEIPGQAISEHARIEVKLNGDNVDINYPSIVANGGKIDIRSVVQSNNDYFVLESPNLIICATGVPFQNNYCYVARSYLIDANAFQITAYKVLLRAYEAALKAFKVLCKLSDVYPAAHEAVKKDYPMLVPNLTMTVGIRFGIAFRQHGLPANLFTDGIIKAGKHYTISLGFQNVLTGTDNLQTFSLLLGDTLFVGNGEPEVFTCLCSKDVKEVVFFSDDDTRGAEPEMEIVYNGNGALYSKTTLQSGKHETSKKELLTQFQAELAPKRLVGSGAGAVYNWSYVTASNEHIGSRYNNLCSNVARSFLIDPNALLSKAYTYLSRAHEAATYAVIQGSEVRDVYIAAVAVVKICAPELLPNLTKTAGTCIGTQFGEPGLAMDLNNDHVIKAGMVFKISIGFQNISSEAGNPRSLVFSLFLEDLVVVTNSGRVVITQLNSKDVKDVTYTVSDAKEELELSVELQKRPKIDLARLRRPWVEFRRQKKEEACKRLSGWNSGKLIAYMSVKDVPRPAYRPMIGVHYIKEAVLLPIHGDIVPLHIATVNRVSTLKDTNDNFYIRIFFNVPRRQFTPCDDAIYLKEVSYLTRDPDHFETAVKQIRTLKKIIENRESKRAESTMSVVLAMVEPLGSKFKSIVLSNVWIHPPFGDEYVRKRIGVLEARIDRFRYSTSKQDAEGVDIMYANIKHAFFQPAENENEEIALIHFHLHNHVMVGNTKTTDVQFYADVVQTLGDCCFKINMDFQIFVNNLTPRFKELGLAFEQPLKKLGFHGVVAYPYNSKSFIVPTSSCLVGLIETPFVVITLSEIEIVSLERFRQEVFDMAIVFSDFQRDVVFIDSIPSTSSYGITEWLDSADIKYYVNKRNRNWNAIMEAFSYDPQVFEEVGGWDFLKQEEASDSATDTDTDDEYEPESSDSEDFNDEEDSFGRLQPLDLGVLGEFRSVLYHV